MDRSEVLARLRAHQEEISRFGVRSLSLFGSVARDEAGSESDVDVLVEFEEPLTFARYMDLKLYLEDLFGTRVDLVDERALKPRARPRVERDLIRVAYVPANAQARQDELTPTVRRLLGVVRGGTDREDYRAHVLQKYGE